MNQMNQKDTLPKLTQITLIVIDDHPLFRQGVVETLSLEKDAHVLGQADNGADALKLMREKKPDIALLDVNLPDMNGQQVTHQAMREKLPTRIILMTGYDDVEQAIHAARAGARGFCSKSIETRRLAHVVREVAAGKFFFDGKSFTRRELDSWIDENTVAAQRSYSEPGALYRPLSDREMEVLDCVVRGMSNKEIAALLHISHQTVKNHVTSILRKFGVEDRTQAVVFALKRGWVSLSDKHI
ncbi:MAG: response regulator transcription factor [Anaerolineales bacterium]